MRLLLLNFLALLLTMTYLNANEHFVLPEEKSDMIFSLKSKIERAQKLRIMTQNIAHSTLNKSIEKQLLKDGTFELIVVDKKSAGYFAKYINTTVYLPPEPQTITVFNLNILIVDESDVCFSSLPFSSVTFQRDIGQVLCTTNKEEIIYALDVFKRFKERFVPYHL